MKKLNHTERLKLTLCVVITAVVAVLLWSSKASSSNGEQASAPRSVETTQTQAQSSQATAQTQPTTQADAKAEGCLACHNNIEPMHKYGPTGALEKLNDGKDAQGMTCTACHGGNPAAQTKEDAHVRPKYPDSWKKDGKYSSANPERTNTLLARESWEFVRFINPGDLRVAAKTCGECHATESNNVARSMMTHGAMLWGAALYNNGGFPIKDTRFGESYSEGGGAQTLLQIPVPSREQTQFKGWLAFIDPLPPWNISQPGNVLRVFERGGKRRLEVGLPDKEEEPGKPDKGLSPRGLGTNNRTDPVFLGLQKTRLLDPTLGFLGTNDHAGDYRSSGCTACHVIYANDRDPVHSALYAASGNEGQSQSSDQNIPRGESGHPIKHQFTSAIPTSQCMVCHMHPGTNMIASYLGLTWWDNETDGDKMYPEKQVTPSQDDEQRKLDSNPEGSSLRGLWSANRFLNQTGTREFNRGLKRTQFADFHGHGWVFRAVYKKNRKGDLLDASGEVVSPDDPDKFSKAVHLKDIHLEKGMHCADCHFRQDSHGNGFLYNEPRAGIEVGCVDCHGSINRKATLLTSSFGAQELDPAAERDKRDMARRKTKLERASIPFTDKDLQTGTDLTLLETRDADDSAIKAFERITKAAKRKDKDGNEIQLNAGDIVQHSLVEPGRWWKIKQTIDTITPGTPDYNEKSRYAKTIRTDNQTWGDVPKDDTMLAHRDSNMTCYACHSSWVTGCFGCHLSMQANKKMPNRHFEGGDSRNFTTYNFQVLRDDIFMLGRDGTVTGYRVAPVRSSSAVLVSSQNQNREWIYSQQQTVSAEGFAGQTFNTHVPHTVRATETKGCSDCHVSNDNDNNAWMAQLLLQGTNFVNFMGQYVYVAASDALEAVAVTEHTEPQAVFGSTLQRLAYPDDYREFEQSGRKLKTAYEHTGNPRVLQVQVRGEYAYVAAGEGGLRVYDIAQIDQKGFSERITTAPVSPYGQKFYVDTKYATAVAAPSTLAVDPARWKMTVDAQGNYKTVSPDEAKKLYEKYLQSPMQATTLLNEEQPIHPLYAYLYVVDKYEGLILVNAATLLDGDPTNNFLSRALTFNPDGVLNDANNITIAGTHAIITTGSELVFVNLNDPLRPFIEKRIGAAQLKHPRSVAVQFRYAFVVDDEGLKVIDITRLHDKPDEVHVVENAFVPLRGAVDVYVARTYAYVAAGKEGVAIIDVERPDKPRLEQMFDGGGALKDAHQIKVAMTNASLFAYVADGAGGLKILQLTDPETMPNYAGFSPRPNPRLIASYKTKGEALAISKPLDRDRAADESGNQVSVFGRRGARPFNLMETTRLMRAEGGVGSFFTVTDKPATKPLDFKVSANAKGSDDNSSPDVGSSQSGVSGNLFAQLSAVGLFMALAITLKLRQKRLERA
jgi:hypothetical protein